MGIHITTVFKGFVRGLARLSQFANPIYWLYLGTRKKLERPREPALGKRRRR